MAEYTKQHYIPQFYLKHFTFGDSAKIFCYDKLKDKSFLTTIRDTGQENLFYGIKGLINDEIEKSLLM